MIPHQAVSVVSGVQASPSTAGLHAVLLMTLLVLVVEQVVVTAVEGDASRRVSGGLRIGLIPLGIATAFVLAQSIG